MLRGNAYILSKDGYDDNENDFTNRMLIDGSTSNSFENAKKHFEKYFVERAIKQTTLENQNYTEVSIKGKRALQLTSKFQYEGREGFMNLTMIIEEGHRIEFVGIAFDELDKQKEIFQKTLESYRYRSK